MVDCPWGVGSSRWHWHFQWDLADQWAPPLWFSGFLTFSHFHSDSHSLCKNTFSSFYLARKYFPHILGSRYLWGPSGTLTSLFQSTVTSFDNEMWPAGYRENPGTFSLESHTCHLASVRPNGLSLVYLPPTLLHIAVERISSEGILITSLSHKMFKDALSPCFGL